MTHSDTAIVCCFFNFQDYAIPRYNLLRFIRQMEAAGRQVFGMELVKVGQKPVTGTLRNWANLVANNRNFLWQKEAMWNAVIRRLPVNIRKVICLDTDLWFENQHWFEEVALRLDSVKVVCPFETAMWTDRFGVVTREQKSAIAVHLSGKDFISGHPGFAFAARRDFWEGKVGGLFHWAPLGQGDTIAMAGVLGGVNGSKEAINVIQRGVGKTKEFETKLEGWLNLASEWTSGSVDFVPGKVWHEWHGEYSDRKYYERHEKLLGLVPADLCTNQAGLLQWSERADLGMMFNVASYFAERKEDG